MSKHENPIKSPEYVLLEAADYTAFTAGKTLALRGRHHRRAAAVVVRVMELAQRARLTPKGVGTQVAA